MSSPQSFIPQGNYVQQSGVLQGNHFQLHGSLLGANAMNPYHRHDSSPRGAMIANHLGQSLVVKGATERMVQTGYEREYGKYTFGVTMPCNAQIVEIIPRYRVGGPGSVDSINYNPQTIVIYEDQDTKVLGMLSLTDYCSNHQYFGFQFDDGPGMKELYPRSYIPKGTVFKRSPNVNDEGGYKIGLEANICYATLPATSEDGVLISDALLPRLGFHTYENRVVEWGQKKFALNLYGDENNYKPFPDIGDRIREDGVLMALRPYGPDELAIVEQSVRSTMEVDYTFDSTVYVNGPGGRVVDIKIHHDIHSFNHAERHMDKQAQKYDHERRIFYKRIVEVWKKYNRLAGGNLQITPELSRMVVEAQSVASEGEGQRVGKLYRQIPLDDYRVEFVIEYDIVPGIGFKITDLHGGKGVICQVAKAEDMPVDADGNRAEIVMDPNSTISRMNLGRLYEQYINAASRDVHKSVCKMLEVKLFEDEDLALMKIQSLSQDQLQQAYQYLLGYYKITSPNQYGWHVDGKIDETVAQYMAQIVNRGVTLYMPPDNPVESEDMVLALEEHYRPCYGPITYRGNSGRLVTTKDFARIGSMYVILLEKIGDDWSAVSSGKLQHFGVLSQLTKVDKYAKPARNQAVRGAGEAEVRIFISYIGPLFMAEMMDRNNNPQTHKAIVSNILKALHPSNIDNLVDRRLHPFGGSKPVQLVNHIIECGGARFQYAPYKPPSQVAPTLWPALQ